MSELEFGKCEMCGKEAPLSRTYFVYDIHCECCGCMEDGRWMHTELVRHCKDCVPDIPQVITLTVKSKIDHKSYTLKIDGMRPFTIRGKYCIKDFHSQE